LIRVEFVGLSLVEWPSAAAKEFPGRNHVRRQSRKREPYFSAESCPPVSMINTLKVVPCNRELK